MEKNYIGVTATLEGDELSTDVEDIVVTDEDRTAVENLGVKDETIAMIRILDSYCDDVLEYLCDNLRIDSFEEKLERVSGFTVDTLEDYIANIMDELDAREDDTDFVLDIKGLPELIENEVLAEFEKSDYDECIVNRKLYEMSASGLGKLVAESI